jgi:murein DD-endopeptidase MepM/ murein hydrolase activator NlpD
VTAISQGNAKGGSGASVKSGGWIPSVSGDYRKSSSYGMRNGKFHHGVDIAVPKGTSMASTVSGKVIFAGMGKSGSGYGGYGYTVAVQDSSGNVHLFAHMDSVSVKAGQTVNRGSYIGKSGNSGDSDGAHLHYEVRIGGKLKNTIDPTKYL